ncbi:lipase family protein [Chryseobacterium indologenes]|uniref:lipase family protein n=1 Tax=Chryseobacterium indologenes TaxID=253 RepID=UPI0023E8EDD1|nr:lipase family protein [Chryseobacterium indologenes]WET50775.1 lipase family protein [Chryseobacterium indologenes]
MKLLLLLCITAAGLCNAQDELLSDINPSNFNRDFSEYNQQTALFCAQISEVAYWDKRNIGILKEQVNKNYPEYRTDYTLINDTYGIHHNQVLLWANQDFMVIAFRGTEPSVLKDWLTDSKYWNYQNADGYDEELSYLPPGHGGFRRSLTRLMNEKNLIEEIKLIIKKLNPQADAKTYPIYVTGHSLGAALAQLFIVPLGYNQLSFKGAYHFAPPLAVSCQMNAELREKYGNVVYDIVNYKDYVPRAGRNGTAHFGKFYRICNDGLVYKEEEAYVKFKLSEYFNEFKLHALRSHIDSLRKEENSFALINERSKDKKPFPCMELKGKPRLLCP